MTGSSACPPPNIVTVTEIVRCGWCGRPVEQHPGRGRPRGFCRRSCRQRAYESRRRARELGLGDAEIVLRRTELADLQDRIYMLRCAIEDVDRDRAEDDSERTVRTSLAWLLENARAVTA
jgi:hypothetical protein